MKKIILLLSFAISFFSTAQRIGNNNTGTSPDANTMLDVATNDKGKLFSKTTFSQDDGINTSTNEMEIYYTDYPELYNNSDCDTWRKVSEKLNAHSLAGGEEIIVGKKVPSQNESGVPYVVTPLDGATSYTWTVPSGASIVSGSGTNSIVVDFTTPGAGFICVSITNACGIIIENCLFIDVCPLPAPPVANAETGLSPSGFTANWIASNDANKYYLDAATDISFTNFIPGYQNLDVGNVTTYTVSATLSCGNDYYYRIRSSNDCGVGVNSNVITASLTSAPTASAAGPDQTLNCDDDFTTLAANIPVSGVGTWTVISGTATITSPNSPTTAVTGLSLPDNVTLRWTITACGSSTDDVIITTSSCCSPAGPYTFTNCSQVGRSGPSQGQCNSAYTATLLAGNVTVTSGIQEWTVPTTGTYRIEVWGAQGGNQGNGSARGGYGAYMSGDFSLSSGDKLKILIGQHPVDVPSGYSNNSGGGGGGSFVADNLNNPYIVAGGGGGSHNNSNGVDATITTSGTKSASNTGTEGTGGNGGSGGYGGSGAGFNGNGADGSWGQQTGGISFVNGGSGGPWNAGYSDSDMGGFGGAGSTHGNCLGGGGGGGYSGGANNSSGCTGGGGGGSYNSGTNQTNQAGVNSGHGYVTINLVCP